MSRRPSRRLQSRLDQVGLQSHSSHPHARHHAQYQGVGAPLWPLCLAAGHRRRPARRRRTIHVPNQHGPHEKSGIYKYIYAIVSSFYKLAIIYAQHCWATLVLLGCWKKTASY